MSWTARRSTHDKISSCGGDEITHFFSQTDKKPARRAFYDIGYFA